MSDLIAGDVLDVGRVGLSGAVEWSGPFAVLEAEGHAVLVRDLAYPYLDEGGPVDLRAAVRVSYGQIRRRMIGPALPAWLERESAGRSFDAGDRVVTAVQANPEAYAGALAADEELERAS